MTMYKYEMSGKEGHVEAEDSRKAAQTLLGKDKARYSTGNQWMQPEVFYGASSGTPVFLYAIDPKPVYYCGKGLVEAVAELEVEMISNAIKISGGNLAQAARLLNVNRTTMYEKMVRYGMER